ncbi:hypothetical protein HNV12_02445 [Methanococcoides sp. SA1]|nr:hypothetical protein [Methanococcoides sp. SA1]
MEKITNFLDLKKTKVGKLANLTLQGPEKIVAGFSLFNTVNSCEYQLRRIFFPFIQNLSVAYSFEIGEPFIYGKIQTLSEVYPQDLISKGMSYKPAYQKPRPKKRKDQDYVLIPEIELKNTAQRKLLETITEEARLITMQSMLNQPRIYEKSHNKKIFSDFPVEYLEQLYNLPFSPKEGERYFYYIEKKAGSPFILKEAEKLMKRMRKVSE